MCENIRFAIGDVPLHLVNVDLTDDFTILVRTIVRPVHVNVHNVLRDHL